MKIVNEIKVMLSLHTNMAKTDKETHGCLQFAIDVMKNEIKSFRAV